MKKRIYLTIDIECHDIKRRNQYIDGIYKKGNCGLEHILELSREYNIPVNCFVDIPETNEYGEEYIKEIIDLIHNYGQHVYLHLHPDYISNDHSRTFLWEYSKSEKKEILSEGFELYENLLGHSADCFRVGRYGADREMYETLNDLGRSVCDLSFNAYSSKMCHIDSNELGTLNKPIKYFKHLIMPNTRYLGLKLGKRKVFFNFDASETTLNEYKRIITESKLNQMVLTMHSWNFIKKYFFLKDYVGFDRYEEKKFKKMIDFARQNGYDFCDLRNQPPVVDDSVIDEALDLCKGIKSLIPMIINNYIRFKRIGRLNKKYFYIYSIFHISSVMLILSLLWIVLLS